MRYKEWDVEPIESEPTINEIFKGEHFRPAPYAKKGTIYSGIFFGILILAFFGSGSLIMYLMDIFTGWDSSFHVFIPLIFATILILTVDIPATLYSYFLVQNTEYWMDETGIHSLSGIWGKNEKFVPYDEITNISVSHGLIEKKYGLATLRIYTASSEESPEITLNSIKYPDEIKKFIMSKISGQ